MSEAGFRAWLEASYSPNTVSTKMFEWRQLTKAYGDLDHLYDADGLSGLMESLRYSTTDKAQNRPNPSKLTLTSDLYRDLSNFRTTVNYYRRYRGEKVRLRPDVDAVNKAIEECQALGVDAFLDTYGFRKDIDYWVVRNGTHYPSKAVFGVAHQFMPGGAPLDGRSCDGSEARQHLAKLGFEIVKDEAATSEPPITLFDAQGSAYVPQKQRNRNSGTLAYWVKPPGAKSNASDEMQAVASDLEIVKTILIDKWPARIKMVEGGQPGLMKFGAGTLVRYELRPDIADAIRHSLSDNYGNAIMASPTLPTNLILYGPPGTGKTYATAAEAVRLCGEAVPADRDELMVLYRSLQQKGRIAFVTFHQNFSYEDFVEGLRPVTASAEEGIETGAGFSLQPQDGIFKLIADLAASNRGKADAGSVPAVDSTRKIFKMSLGRSWASEDDAIYLDAISGRYVVLGWGGNVDWSDARYDAWEAIAQRWRQDHPDASGNDPNISQMYTFRNNMQIGSLVVISDGNRKFRAVGEIKGPYKFVQGTNGEYNHRREVRWLWHSDESLPRELIYGKELSQVSAYQMNSRHVNWDGLEQIVASGDAMGTGNPESFVLIIDEINRANISKVFGELITLLEPDKRLGMPNGLTVRLPYSKQEFGVPANLHVIGTMNTADRSIALLDTALRRRFVFREISPNPLLLPEDVAGVPLRRVLQTINDRIEYLIDREHRIGHAFFIGYGGKDRAAIDATMRDKVIPLLQEYFFEDWSRVAAVLGEPEGKGGGFLDCRKLRDPTGRDGEERESWSVRTTFASDAYERLIGKLAQSSPAQTSEGSLDEAAE